MRKSKWQMHTAYENGINCSMSLQLTVAHETFHDSHWYILNVYPYSVLPGWEPVYTYSDW